MNSARSLTAERSHAARPGPRSRGFATLMLGLLMGCLLWAVGQAAGATEREADVDPPGRVGRIVEVQGNVSRFDAEENRWSDAERNRPLTTGDRLSTAGGARVELRVGSTSLRLGAGTELEVLRLDDERLSFQVHSGSLALRVRTREKAAEVEVVTAEARLLPLRAGHYRIDRIDDTTFAASLRGDLRVDDARRLTATTGQRLELFRDSKSGEARHVWRGLQNDEFAAWVQADDRRDERAASGSSQYVSPEMTGAEDLDRWGTWDRHPDYGPLWYPSQVAVGWAPYRYGRWVWVRPWGWTWVDEAPWGFAPFHYGRWVWWRERWCWAPGTYVARPVYAPALVAWVGGPSVSVSVNIGGPVVGWVPLAPREYYVPYYRVTPVYVDRINVHPRGPGHYPQTVPTGPIAYTNQGVPGAVSVVPRDVLVRREPVARAIVNVPEVHRAPGTVAPPAPVAAVAPAPVGRVPPPRNAMADDGRAGHQGSERRPATAAPAAQGAQGAQGVQTTPGAAPVSPVSPVSPASPVAPAPRIEPARPEGGRADTGAPAVVPGRPAGAAANAPVTAPAPGREYRDGRDARDVRDIRDDGRERRRDPAADSRPLRAVPPAAPAQAAPAQPRVQAAPAAPPVQAAPRQQAAPVAPAGAVITPPPAPRVQAPAQAPQSPRAGAEDDRKRTGQPRHGEREREATR